MEAELNGSSSPVTTMTPEPIAVIGMAIHFPGEATSPKAFWEMLEARRSAWGPVPADRFNAAAFYHPDPDRADAMRVQHGFFLAGDHAAARFDAPFFSISQAEATSMDPQQRGLLETSYHAIESAGLRIEDLAGSKTAVFVGAFSRDWDAIVSTRDPLQPARYAATGTGPALLANRVSWFYHLHGTSITLDTACSSGMHALHLACETLRTPGSGNDAALVGGCNLILGPESTMIPLSNLGFLSPDGRCYAFDKRANGYARGEGFGFLVLKRLRDAAAAGDTIRAVIRATATNQDGRTPGIAQPSVDAQETLIRQTYVMAGLSLRETRLFEAHGTGTAVGDPIEAEAVARVFAPHRSDAEPMIVGAVKTNVGHLESGSALAGLVKVILALEKGVIPPNYGFTEVSDKIPAKDWKLAFPTEAVPWPSGVSVRRASVNSFGYGGANGHAVLDDAASFLAAHGFSHGRHRTTTVCGEQHGSLQDRPSLLPSPRLLVWSAADKEGIGRMSAAYQAYTNAALQTALAQESASLEDIAYTLGSKRSKLPWKSFLTVSSLAQLHEKLQSHGLPRPTRTPSSSKTATAELAFVFTGQGAQWWAMGRELFVYPVFGASVQAAEDYLRSPTGPACGWSALEELRDGSEDEQRVNDTVYAQALCTILQVALVDLLASWNVRPHAVVGHSSGEIAAAYCTGALSREAAWKTAYLRGALAAQLEKDLASQGEPGAMMTVGASEHELQSYLNQLDADAIAVGCVNAPTNVTVTGSAEAVTALQSLLGPQGIFCRRLNIRVPYHSRRMHAVEAAYRDALARLEPGLGARSPNSSSSKLPTMYSSLTAKLVFAQELQAPEYWAGNLVSRVRFSEALCALVNATGIEHFIEIGPTAALKRPVGESAPPGHKLAYYSVLSRGQSATESALNMAGRLYCAGCDVDISAINASSTSPRSLLPRMAVDLPFYPFNHAKTYWHESRLSRNFRLRTHPRHELLGTQVPDWNELEPRWRNLLRLAEMSWLLDHCFDGAAIYPAAGMVVMAIEAARQLAPASRLISGFRIRNLYMNRALLVSDAPEGVEVQLSMRAQPSPTGPAAAHDVAVFRLYRHSGEHGDSWTRICEGTVVTEYGDQPLRAEVEAPETAMALHAAKTFHAQGRARCLRTLDTRLMYESLACSGIDFGPAFQTLNRVRVADVGKEAAATVQLREWEHRVQNSHVQPHVIHPLALDGIFQLTYVALARGGADAVPTMVPSQIRDLWISPELLNSAPDAAVHVYAQNRFTGMRDAEFFLSAVDSKSGEPRVTVQGYRATALTSLQGAGSTAQNGAAAAHKRLCYEMEWKPDIDLLAKEELAQICIRRGRQVYDKTSHSHREHSSRVDLLCRYYMAQAMADVEKAGGIPSAVPRHIHRYAAWVNYQLKRLDPETLANAVNCLQDVQEREDVLKKTQAHGADGELLVTVCRNLSQILLGKVDALTLYFRGTFMANFYQAAEMGTTYAQLAAYMDLAGHKNSNMHILEVGAGTGGATAHVLAALGVRDDKENGNARTSLRFASYTYTDISPQFLADAAERFRACAGRMIFKTLDIGAEPIAQGFAAGSFDVLIASFVLHATPVIATTVQNARRLLRPGGKLILLELTDREALLEPFIFAALPGWWLGEEEGRTLSPLLSQSGWDCVLRANGFAGADLAMGDTVDVDGAGADPTRSVIVAEAIHEKAGDVENGQVQDKTDHVVIVADEQDAFQQSVARELCKAVTASQPGQRVNGTTQAATTCHIVPLTAFETLDPSHVDCIFLPELTRPVLHDISEMEYVNVQKLAGSAASVVWVTSGGGERPQDPLADLATGFGRTMCSERRDLRFCTLALESAYQIVMDTDAVAANIFRVWKHQSSLPVGVEHETDYMQCDGQLNIARLTEAHQLNDIVHAQKARREPELEPFGEVAGGKITRETERNGSAQDAPLSSRRALSLTAGSVGLLDTLHFVHDAEHLCPLGPFDVELRVHASGLNFKDVMIAMGQMPDANIGFDAAGVVTRVGSEVSKASIGDRVCALVRGGSFKTYARTHIDLVAVLPREAEIPFVEAASYPVVFLTAYYALHEAARLRPGETILVHAGAGGVGQAAIQLAQLLGARVLATVSTAEKKRLLVDKYGLDPEDVFSSRSLNFGLGLRRRTQDRGVDVVLNSLAGDALDESWRLLAPMGRFIEIGKRDINDILRSLPMHGFAVSTTFAAVDLGVIAEQKSRLCGNMLQIVMNHALQGTLKAPQPLHCLPVSELEQAFRGLQSGRLAGKVVVEMNNADPVPVAKSVEASHSLDVQSSYLISGGLGGLGRSIAKWLVSRGARYLILLSPSGLSGPHARELVDNLNRQSVAVVAPPCDVSVPAALRSALEEAKARGFPPIRGCIQAAMVLRDGIFENMTHESFVAALRPKVQGSWNLHLQLPQDLDFFVLLSSVGGILGNRCQANYAAANTYQDALARYRLANGLPAVALDLGMMLDVGFVAETAKVRESLVAAGYMGMTEAELLRLLSHVCNPDTARAALKPENPLFRSQVVLGVATPALLQQKEIPESHWMSRPMFRHLRQMDGDDTTNRSTAPGTSTDAEVKCGSLLATAPNATAAAKIVQNSLLRRLSKVLTLPQDDIDLLRPASAVGVDSLVAVELKYWFLSEIGADIAVFEILGNASLGSLCRLAVTKSSVWKGDNSG